MSAISSHQTIEGHPNGHAHDHGHSHGHDHPPHLAHHWSNSKQQFEAGKLGMWLFLATEVLLFGGLFCAYAVWRGNHPELFKYGSQFLDTTMGATNTVVLILSSLTMAWGVTAAQKNQQGLLKLMLTLTLIGAATFMVIKYFEYTHKFHEGWYPGIKFYDMPEHSHTFVYPKGEQHADAGESSAAASGAESTAADHAVASTEGSFELETIAMTPHEPALPPAEASTIKPPPMGPTGLAEGATLVQKPFTMEEGQNAEIIHPLQDPKRPRNAHMFFNIYFMMTGLHGIHVLIGMGIISWLLIKAFRGHFSSEYFTPVDLGGLYWHIVDLIWIFLFPLFYLI